MYQLEVKPINTTSYENKLLACQECYVHYNPHELRGALTVLRIPALYANAFCSRRCLERAQEKALKTP